MPSKPLKAIVWLLSEIKLSKVLLLWCEIIPALSVKFTKPVTPLSASITQISPVELIPAICLLSGDQLKVFAKSSVLLVKGFKLLPSALPTYK